MAQFGIHGMVALGIRKWVPEKKLLISGIVLGSMIPDLDNFAVAIATLTGSSTDGLHRTLTHSLFFAAFILLIFYLIGLSTKEKKWQNLGLGLSIGVVLHILVDLLLWYNGVALLWPIPLWVNFWSKTNPPAWWAAFMNPLELLALVIYFLFLKFLAKKHGSNQDYLKWLQIWIIASSILFVIFTYLAYTMQKGFMTIFGAVYLLCLCLAIGVTIRMRDTIEAK